MASIKGQITINEVLILEVDDDPTLSGGINAPIGSMALKQSISSGESWLKVGPSGTDWQKINTGPIVTYGTPVTQTPDQTNASGTSTSVARADHIHNIPTATAVDISTTNTQGTDESFARSDHTHRGIRSLRVDSGTQRFGNINIISGSGILINDNGSGDFTISSDPVYSVGDGKVYFEDFFLTTADVDKTFNWSSVQANGGVVSNPDNTVGTTFLGKSTIATGTTNNSTGRASIESTSTTDLIQFGGLPYIIEMRVRIPTLSTGTVNFQFLVGVADAPVAGLPVNGVFFYYNHNINSGGWRGVTRSAATSTNVDSTVTVNESQWYKLKFEVNSAGNQVKFYVNDVNIGTSTLNIPTAAMSLFAQIEKQAPNTNQSRTGEIDYFYMKVIR